MPTIPMPPDCTGCTLADVQQAMTDAGLPPAYHPLYVTIDDVIASTKTVYFTWKSRSGFSVAWNDPKMVWTKCHSTIKTDPNTGLPSAGDKGLLHLSKTWSAGQPPGRVADLPRPKYPLDLGAASVMPAVDVEIRRLWAMVAVPFDDSTHRGWIELSSPDLVAPGCKFVQWAPGTLVTVELLAAAQAMLGDRMAGAPKKYTDAEVLELWATLNVKAPNSKLQTTDFYTLDLTDEAIASLPESRVYAATSMMSSIAFTETGMKSMNIDPSDPDFWTTDEDLAPLIEIPDELRRRWPWSDNPEWDELRRVSGVSAFANVHARRAHLLKCLRQAHPTKR